MKFGMNLLLWTGDVSDEHLPIIEKLKGLGFDGVEVPMFEYNVKKFADLSKKLDKLGLERTAVTVRNSGDNPISSDAAVRAKGVELNRQAVDCCAALGAKLLCGPFHSALGVFSGKGPTSDEHKWGVDSMRIVAEHAGGQRVRLAVEYLNRFECYFLTSAADTARFVKDVGHPACRMMYDTFHANIEEKDIPAAIRGSADSIVHVHISENDRSTPGAGHVHWKETFDTLKQVGYDGWLMVEAFGLALPELAAATKIWRRMYVREEQLARAALKFMKDEWAKRG
jgi:D-psicose/D-tagatose/L-ribulose 3-epimerase